MKGKVTLMGSLIFIGLLYFYWRNNVGPVSSNKNCKTEKRFTSMEFKAVILDTNYNQHRKYLSVQTFEGENATLDLSLDSNHIFEKLAPQDTLFKEFGSMELYVKNNSKYLVLIPQFNCK